MMSSAWLDPPQDIFSLASMLYIEWCRGKINLILSAGGDYDEREHNRGVSTESRIHGSKSSYRSPEVEISAIATALNRDVLSLLARDDNDRLIGMGRVVGDGAFYFQLVDIMVAASHLDQGVEEMIVSELLSRLAK